MGRFSIPVGETEALFEASNVIGFIEPQETFGVPDVSAEIKRALSAPIGTVRLKEIAAGKKTAAIVVNDITRPYPGREMVLAIAEELNEAGMDDDGISLIMAYGHHRDNTAEELAGMFGEDVCSRFRIVHHHATEAQTLTTVGVTSAGIPVEINKQFAEAEVKITTGCITPHQLAGYSGGRKSILPGISGMNALKIHHSFPIRPDMTSLGWLDGNPFHEQALEAARIARVDFIVNSVDNAQRGVVRCVAGDIEKAYLVGVELCRSVWSAKAPGKADIVIVSPGGYPRDFDLHQSQKALGCAEMLCKPNGRIILCAEMRDGQGRPGKVLEEAESPEAVVEAFKTAGYTPQALSKAYMIARALCNFRISVAGSRIPQETLREMFFDGFETIDEAMQAAYAEQGREARVLIVPHASDIIPVIL